MFKFYSDLRRRRQGIYTDWLIVCRFWKVCLTVLCFHCIPARCEDGMTSGDAQRLVMLLRLFCRIKGVWGWGIAIAGNDRAGEGGSGGESADEVVVAWVVVGAAILGVMKNTYGIPLCGLYIIHGWRPAAASPSSRSSPCRHSCRPPHRLSPPGNAAGRIIIRRVFTGVCDQGLPW